MCPLPTSPTGATLFTSTLVAGAVALVFAAGPALEAAPTAAGVELRGSVPAEPYEGDDFYAAPDPLPDGPPGALLRYEPISEYRLWENFDDELHAHGLQLLGDHSGSLFVLRDATGQLAVGGADDSVGPDAAELVAWLEEHPGLLPVDTATTSVGGLEAVQVDVAVDPGYAGEMPDWCDPGDVCIPLVRAGGEGPQAEFFLVGDLDVARLIIVDLSADDDAAEARNLTIVLDPWDWARTDAVRYYEAAADLLGTFEFGVEPSDPGAVDCESWWDNPCHGWLEAGETYSTFDFEPSFAYTVPEPDGGATAWRIMYLSESIAGEPIAVTGIALLPAEGAEPAADRPVLSVAHGTTGVGDDCAISKDPTWDLVDFSAFANSGHIVAYTDYEGLGTPGRHPFLVGESEGRGVLDAARASSQLPGAAAGDQMAIWGHSQGGHAALWAGEIAAEWAPELDVVGVVAGAPATDLELTGEGLPSEFIGFIALAAAGYDAAYDDIDAAMVLTDTGVAELGIVDEGCEEEVLEHYAAFDPDEIVLGVDAAPEWSARLAENDPGQVPFDAPVLIVDAADDEIIPTDAIDALVETMCGNGHDVERRTVDGDHGDAWWWAHQDGFDWIADRFAGADTTPTC